MTIEIYKDAAGEHRWRMRHANGNVIADSGEGYKNRNDCVEAINSIVEACRGDIVFVDID